MLDRLLATHGQQLVDHFSHILARRRPFHQDAASRPDVPFVFLVQGKGDQFFVRQLRQIDPR